MKKKKMLDPQIVRKRTELMMEHQLEELARFFGEFERYGEPYYAWLKSGQILTIRYYEDVKFMSKVFSTRITLELENIVMERSWKARLSFRGLKTISRLVWQPVKKSDQERIRFLNEWEGFNERLLSLCQSLDLITIELDYAKDARRLLVSILPYAGSYVWIKLPPAYCDIPLKPFEAEAIYEIVSLFVREFEQYQSSQTVQTENPWNMESAPGSC